MAKGGLSKLRCMIRRWHSSSRISRVPSPGEDEHGRGGASHGASFHGADEVPKGLRPVYVGKSRRRYLIAEELVGHRLFQTLVDRTGGAAAAAAPGCTVVGCEVVLFEHMLWMLENADPPPESLDELVEYYACLESETERETPSRAPRHDGGPPELEACRGCGGTCFQSRVLSDFSSLASVILGVGAVIEERLPID